MIKDCVRYKYGICVARNACYEKKAIEKTTTQTKTSKQTQTQTNKHEKKQANCP